MKSLTIEEVKKLDLVKFVRVAGEYRFCYNYNNHCDLVELGEIPLSAGVISIYSNNKKFKFCNSWSSTLKIGVDQNDDSRLSLLLGYSFIDDF